MVQIPIAEIYIAMLVISRVGALFFMLPLFSSSIIPDAPKVALISIFSILLVPTVAPTTAVPSHIVGLVIAMLGEVIIGLMMGFGGRLLFFAVEFAAELIAVESSLMMAKSFDPTTEAEGSVLTPLYVYLTTMVFLITGTHLEVMGAFVRSYDYVPAGLGVFALQGVEHITHEISGVFELGLRMAAPFIALSFIINLVFAILGKVAAKIQVMVISFGLRIVLAMLLMAMSVPLMLRYITDGLDGLGLRLLEFVISR